MLEGAREVQEDWMNGINLLADIVHKGSREKGWWDKPREPGTLLMLVVTELAEAMEEHRHSRPLREVYYVTGDQKPEGFGIELADALIRILDTARGLGIDIAEMVRTKHAYNLTRSHRHGNKVC